MMDEINWGITPEMVRNLLDDDDDDDKPSLPSPAKRAAATLPPAATSSSSSSPSKKDKHEARALCKAKRAAVEEARAILAAKSSAHSAATPPKQSHAWMETPVVPSSAPPHKGQRVVVPSKVIFCFRRIRVQPVAEATSTRTFMNSVLDTLRGRYDRVECLFTFNSDDSHTGPVWHALTVQTNGSGLFHRPVEHYLGEDRVTLPWDFYQMEETPVRQVIAMYAFAQRENEDPRYTITTAASMSSASAAMRGPLITPVVTYTPGCSGCLCSSASGGGVIEPTRQSAALVLKMLRDILGTTFDSYAVESATPDSLLVALQQRTQVRKVIPGALVRGDKSAVR